MQGQGQGPSLQGPGQGLDLQLAKTRIRTFYSQVVVVL